MGWVTADAPRRADLESCVACGLCLPHCPTFRLTGRETESPRGRLAAMSAVAAGLVEVDGAFEAIMESCLQCRACEPVCPSMVPFGRAMEGARVELSAQRSTPGRRLRHLILGRALPRPALVRLAGRTARIARAKPLRRLTPTVLRRPMTGLREASEQVALLGQSYSAHGAKQGRVGLLAGCVMEPWFGDVHVATIEVLRRAGLEVVVPPNQTCCGALSAHDGDARSARRLAKKNVAAFVGVDLIVTNSAGCGAHLKEYEQWAGAAGRGVQTRARDVAEVVAEALADGRLPSVPATGREVAVQDPCHLRNAQRITEQPRSIVRAAGYEPVDIDPAGMCCGAAGVYSLLHPERSAELGARKRAEVLATGATIVASANPGCEMQLRAHLSRDHRVVHPIELYWGALSRSDGPVQGPGG